MKTHEVLTVYGFFKSTFSPLYTESTENIIMPVRHDELKITKFKSQIAGVLPVHSVLSVVKK